MAHLRGHGEAKTAQQDVPCQQLPGGAHSQVFQGTNRSRPDESEYEICHLCRHHGKDRIQPCHTKQRDQWRHSERHGKNGIPEITQKTRQRLDRNRKGRL